MLTTKVTSTVCKQEARTSTDNKLVQNDGMKKTDNFIMSPPAGHLGSPTTEGGSQNHT